jgi:hypothetical protein
MRFARSKLCALAAGLIVLLSASPVRAAGDESLEYAIKATYLYKFAPFIEWPDAAFASPSSAVDLCIVGDDPFGESLSQAVAGQRIGARPVVLRHVAAAHPDSGCHIMFIAGSATQSVAAALDAVRGAHVLTITDSARDPEAKGIIHFVVQEKRVRFDIDDQAASENGITISSKVLSLALSVKPRA